MPAGAVPPGTIGVVPMPRADGRLAAVLGAVLLSCVDAGSVKVDCAGAVVEEVVEGAEGVAVVGADEAGNVPGAEGGAAMPKGPKLETDKIIVISTGGK